MRLNVAAAIATYRQVNIEGCFLPLAFMGKEETPGCGEVVSLHEVLPELPLTDTNSMSWSLAMSRLWVDANTKAHQIEAAWAILLGCEFDIRDEDGLIRPTQIILSVETRNGCPSQWMAWGHFELTEHGSILEQLQWVVADMAIGEPWPSVLFGQKPTKN